MDLASELWQTWSDIEKTNNRRWIIHSPPSLLLGTDLIRSSVEISETKGNFFFFFFLFFFFCFSPPVFSLDRFVFSKLKYTRKKRTSFCLDDLLTVSRELNFFVFVPPIQVWRKLSLLKSNTFEPILENCSVWALSVLGQQFARREIHYPDLALELHCASPFLPSPLTANNV